MTEIESKEMLKQNLCAMVDQLDEKQIQNLMDGKLSIWAKFALIMSFLKGNPKKEKE